MEKLYKILDKFERRLKCLDALIDSGSKEEDLIKLFRTKSDNQIDGLYKKLFSSNNIKYKNLKEILSSLNISESQLADIMLNIDPIKAKAYSYTFGIASPRINRTKILKLLEIDLITYIDYLNEVDNKLPKLVQKYNTIEKIEPKEEQKIDKEKIVESKKIIKIQKEKPIKIKEPKIMKRDSFYNYFPEIPNEIVTSTLIKYKDKSKSDYDLVVKIYGENFDKFNKTIILTDIEKRQILSFRRTIKRDCQKTISGEDDKLLGRRREQSFFDYFTDIPKETVIEILNQYKGKKCGYYEVAIKKYGETLDQLNNEIKLSDAENVSLNNARTTIKKIANKENNPVKRKQNGKKRLQSFYDYFPNVPKEIVTDILNQYKGRSSKFYDIVVKIYGENFDQLNEEVILDDIEKEKIKYIIRTIKNITDKMVNNQVCVRRQRKQSFFNYLPDIPKDKVIEILEIYKETPSEYYEVTKKIYGENFDQLNNDIIVDNRDNAVLHNCINTIKRVYGKMLDGTYKARKSKETKFTSPRGRQRKQSFYDYFSDNTREEITHLLRNYKETNEKLYCLIVKLYGEEFNQLNETIELTPNEKSILSNGKVKMKKELKIISEKKSMIIKNKNNIICPNCYKEYDPSEAFKLYGANFYRKNIPCPECARKYAKSHSLLDYIYNHYSKKYPKSIVIEAINNFRKDYPTHYTEISHRYNGSPFDPKYLNYLTYEQRDNFDLIVDGIYCYILELEAKNEEAINKNQIFKNEQLTFTEKVVIFLKNKYTDESNAEELIANELGISIEDAINIYCKNLKLFNNINQIIFDIIRINPKNVDMLFNTQYFNELFDKLTLQEQMYLYLKLKSVNNDYLTDEKIRNILSISNEFKIENDKINDEYKQFIKKF